MEQLTACQARALDMAFKQRICLITGAAGTGKTHLLRKCVDGFAAQGLQVELAAPTGKAAKRLEQMTGRRAQTIHRLLGYNGEQWQRNRENPIDAEVVTVDEVSMCDSALMYHLLSAIDFRRTRVLLAGDHHQLAPVGPGSILRDILNLDLIPYTVLDEVVRQAGPLRHNSLEVLQGRVVGLRKTDPVTPDWNVIPRFDDAEDALNYLLHLYQAVLSERLGYDLLRDVQVLAPQRTGTVGVENLNLALQAVLQRKLYGRNIPPAPPNRRPPLYPGDKVMQTKNDYGIDVMNGHIGYVVEAEPKRKRWVVDFEDRGLVELDDQKIQRVMLAYACTIHKYQGSEIPCAVCILHSSHSFMLHRNLAYTAVTRARDRAVIIGDVKGIHRAARIQKVDDRRTILAVTGGAVA
jgi:exodeoxyribonuclease V alpha subunit